VIADFSGVVNWRFCWGFCKKWLQNVVFLWSSCGGMRGKRGQLTVVFDELKIGHSFDFIFASRNRRGEPKLPSFE
jgi:hypothetical protein